jgi:lysyl endopeptidase
MDGRNRGIAGLLWLWFSLWCAPCLASNQVDVVHQDLAPLIRAGALSPNQFAVLVPHKITIQSAGAWSVHGGIATWRYTARIPTAISMSFHADKVSLPSTARLTVSGGSVFIYSARDVHKGALWSRITPGDSLNFTLTVATTERSRVALELLSLQAGYRGLGGGVTDHPLYRMLTAQTASSLTSTCVQNYQCSVTTANATPAAATVGLVTENLYQCTGSLINDVPGDDVPYVLTARHCETGQLGGGNPSVASAVTVYWNAVSPCGQTLGSLYDPGIVTQTGAATIVEQQDAWLIQLDTSPVVTNAQLTGFDASGGAVQGGYTIQHSLGYNKQFTEWFGQALAVQQSGVLGVQYSSNFWEVVNQLGNIGPGASGSGLIDQNNHLVGSLSLGRSSNDSSGYESCPVSPPTAPNGSNGAADFTSLAAVWNSTADTTSSTGTVTIKSVLDPASTGTLVVPSIPAATVIFTSSSYSLAEGSSAEITWNAPGATQCTASNGLSGDGWTGTLPAAGTKAISESSAGEVLYTVTCSLSGNRTVNSSLTITWGSPTPSVNIVGSVAVWTTRPGRLTWTSTLAPCAISGGDFSASNLSSSGSVAPTQTTAGDVQYQIVCGTAGGDQAFSGWEISFVTPSVTFATNGTDRLLGQPLTLSWQSYADSCTPSGGAPNDGWTSTAFPNPSTYPSFSPNVAAVGTYTYTLTCSSGPISITKSLVITVENNTPYVSLSINRPSYTITGTSSDGFTLTWNSNLSYCNPSATPILGGFIVYDGSNPQGTATVTPDMGTYSFYVTCAGYQNSVAPITSTPVTGTVLAPPPPTAEIAINPTTVYGSQSFTVTWSSTNAIGCEGTGGVYPTSLQGWAIAAPPSGAEPFTAPAPGTYTFDISCGSPARGVPAASAQATVTVMAGSPPAPTVTVTSTPNTVTEGGSFTVSWSSANANSCSASGGGATGSPWSGTLATAGSQTDAASTVGSFVYTVECSGVDQPTAHASSTVTVTAKSSTTSSSSGSKGGGGTLDALTLAMLSILVALRRRHRICTDH